MRASCQLTRFLRSFLGTTKANLSRRRGQGLLASPWRRDHGDPTVIPIECLDHLRFAQRDTRRLLNVASLYICCNSTSLAFRSETPACSADACRTFPIYVAPAHVSPSPLRDFRNGHRMPPHVDPSDPPHTIIAAHVDATRLVIWIQLHLAEA